MGIQFSDFFNAEEILEGMAEVGHPEPATLVDQLFFGSRRSVSAGSVRYAVRSGKRKLAPYVSDVIGNKTVPRTQRQMSAVRLATLAPSMVITQDDIETRLEGAILTGTTDRAGALRRLQTDDVVEMQNRIVNTWEKQAVDLITSGKAILRGEGVDLEVDIWADLAGGDKPETTLTSTNAWSDTANSTPLEDVRSAMAFMTNMGGVQPNVAIMGTKAVARFFADDAVKRGIDVQALAGTVNVPEYLPGGAQYHGVEINTGLQIWSYGGQYDDQDGNPVRFLHKDDVILGNTAGRTNERVFSPVSLMGAELEDWAFPNNEFNVNTYAQRAPTEGFVTEVKSRTLPIIGDVQAFHVIHTDGS